MGSHSDALGWLNSTSEFLDGETATLRRGHHSTTVTVVRGSNKPKLMSQDGQAYVELEHQEILIRPSQYSFGGIKHEPLPGDRIVIGSETFAAVPYISGEGCWRYTDQFKSHYRIHVQLTND
ncbi:hypothetical protein [Rhodopirellula halodulae]